MKLEIIKINKKEFFTDNLRYLIFKINLIDNALDNSKLRSQKAKFL